MWVKYAAIATVLLHVAFAAGASVAQAVPECVRIGPTACSKLQRLESDLVSVSKKYDVKISELRKIGLRLGVRLEQLTADEVLVAIDKTAAEIVRLKAEIEVLRSLDEPETRALVQRADAAVASGDWPQVEKLMGDAAQALADAAMANRDAAVRKEHDAVRSFFGAARAANIQQKYRQALAWVERGERLAIGFRTKTQYFALRGFRAGVNISIALQEGDARYLDENLAILAEVEEATKSSPKPEMDQSSDGLFGDWVFDALGRGELGNSFVELGRRSVKSSPTEAKALFAKGEALWRDVLANMQATGNEVFEAQAKFHLAMALRTISRSLNEPLDGPLMAEGRRLSQESLAKLSELNTPLEWARAQFLAAQGYAIASTALPDPVAISSARQNAEIKFAEAARVLNHLGRRVEADSVRAELAKANADWGRRDEAKAIFNDILTRVSKDVDPVLWASVHAELGQSKSTISGATVIIDDLVAAIDHFKKALEVYADEERLPDRARVLSLMAETQMLLFRVTNEDSYLTGAVETYTDASGAYSRLGDLRGAEFTRVSLARILVDQGERAGRWQVVAIGLAQLERSLEQVEKERDGSLWLLIAMQAAHANKVLYELYPYDDGGREQNFKRAHEQYVAVREYCDSVANHLASGAASFALGELSEVAIGKPSAGSAENGRSDAYSWYSKAASSFERAGNIGLVNQAVEAMKRNAVPTP